MFIKNRIALFFSLFYLVVNTGLAVNIHFCGEKIASIVPKVLTFEGKTNAPESCCILKAEEKKSCCSDETIEIPSTEENVVDNLFENDIEVIIFKANKQFNTLFSEVLIQKSNRYYFYQSNAPPLYKLYCSYITYS